MATFIYTKYADLDNLEAHVYNFVANPLAYIGHQNQLLEAKEAAAEAYALKVI